MNIRSHILGPLGNKKPSAAKKEINQANQLPFKKQLKEYIRQRKAKLKQNKVKTIILYALLLLAALYVVGVLTSFVQAITHLNLSRDIFHRETAANVGVQYHFTVIPWEAIPKAFILPYSFIVYLIGGLLGLYGFYWWIRNHVTMGDYTVEERAGATYKKQLQDATMGSAREMNEVEVEDNFLILRPEQLRKKNPHTLIFGTLPGTGQYILEKPVGRFDVPNRNCFVVGDAGSWKTSNFIVTNMKQLAKRGDNCVCTDSSGEVFALTYQDFIDNEYEVFVINTTDTEHSDTMNFIGAVRNDLDLAKTVTQTLVESTHKPTDKVDVFFEDGMKTLLPAIIIIVNTELKRYSSIRGIIDFLIRYDTSEKMHEIFLTYKDSQPEAYKQFCLYMMSPVKENFISNLAQRLDIFVSTGISHICSKDGFDIVDRLGTEKKTVIFIITDKTYAFIGALFLNIISKVLVDHAKKNCERRILPHKLFFFFEEFLTMGYVPNMGTFLSENRKFGFVYYLICQAIPQFYLRYDEREAKEIMSNCMFKFFYGTGDTDTAKLFEEYCGLTTVRTAMTAFSDPILKYKDQAREGVQQRSLYTCDELLTLDLEYFILLVTHQHPLKLKKPFYKTIPGSEPPKDFEEMHFSNYTPHDKQETNDKADVQFESTQQETHPSLRQKPELPDSGNTTQPQTDSYAAVSTRTAIPPATPPVSYPENVPGSDKEINTTVTPKEEEKPKKPAKRGRPSNRTRMEEQAVVNLISQYEELPKNRPCINEEDVCESGIGNYLVFKTKRDRNDKNIRANKVVFDIDTTKIKVGGKTPPNEYCTYNTRYNIEELRDKMQVSMEGRI